MTTTRSTSPPVADTLEDPDPDAGGHDVEGFAHLRVGAAERIAAACDLGLGAGPRVVRSPGWFTAPGDVAGLMAGRRPSDER